MAVEASMALPAMLTRGKPKGKCFDLQKRRVGESSTRAKKRERRKENKLLENGYTFFTGRTVQIMKKCYFKVFNDLSCVSKKSTRKIYRTYSTVYMYSMLGLVHTGEVFHWVSIQLHPSKAKISMEFLESVHTFQGYPS